MISEINEKAVNVDSEYNSALTREQFLFYEMRTTVRLMTKGLSGVEVIAKMTEEKIKSILVRIRVKNEYPDDTISDHLNPVLTDVLKQEHNGPYNLP